MMTTTLLDFENALLDLFENNRITIDGAKSVFWTLLAAIYEDELIGATSPRDYYLKHRATEGVASRKYSGPEIDMMISTTSTVMDRGFD